MRKDTPARIVIDLVKKDFMDMDANKLVLGIHQVRKDIKMIGMSYKQLGLSEGLIK